MSKEQVRIEPTLGSKDVNICDRANGEDRRRLPNRRVSWYASRPAASELNYVLTSNGYVVLR